jgi:hypothetical protein
MATGISITPPSALTIGTTAISNGVEGRVLFQGAGDVLQQDAELFWDNVNKRLGVGATPDVNTRLDVRAQGALSTDLVFRVRNSANTANLVSMLGNGDVIVGSQTGGTPSNAKALRIDSSGFSKLHFNTTYNAPSTPTAEITINRRQATFVDDNVWMFQQRDFSDGNNKSYKTYYINPSKYYGTAASIANEGYVAGWSWFTDLRTDANRLMKLSVDGALNLYNRPTLPIETNFVDSFQFYSADITAGNAAPHFRTENGDIIKLFKTVLPSLSTTVINTGDAATDTLLSELFDALKSVGLIAE